MEFLCQTCNNNDNNNNNNNKKKKKKKKAVEWDKNECLSTSFGSCSC